MRSCDNCPGGDACDGNSLMPVLLRVFDLYAGGRTDKFEILFALGEADEKLLETHTANVQRECWTTAGLGAIAEVLVRHEREAAGRDDWPAVLHDTLTTARDAFARFPWRLPDLVEQSADLHAHVTERMDSDNFASAIPKRAFAKACKAVVYGEPE